MARPRQDRENLKAEVMLLLRRYSPKKYSLRTLAKESGLSRKLLAEVLLLLVSNTYSHVEYDGKRYFSTKRLDPDHLNDIREREKLQAAAKILESMRNDRRPSLKSLQKETSMPYKFVKEVVATLDRHPELSTNA